VNPESYTQLNQHSRPECETKTVYHV
jgi:hypothetical protein